MDIGLDCGIAELSSNFIIFTLYLRANTLGKGTNYTLLPATGNKHTAFCRLW